jgi:hypothetical protein
MSNSRDIGTGFAAGLQQGMQIGLVQKAREEARQQQLADRAAAQQLAAQIRAEELARADRRFAAANPEAALAEVGAFRQMGPLTPEAAQMEAIATPLAFQNFQREQAVLADRAALAKEMSALRQTQMEADRARIAAVNQDIAARKFGRTANAIGDAAGTMLDRTALGQLVRGAAQWKPTAKPREQYDTIEETIEDQETGKTTKITRRVPAGQMPPASATSPGASAAPASPADAFAQQLAQSTTAEVATTEAQKKRLKAERDKLEAEQKKKRLEEAETEKKRKGIYYGFEPGQGGMG